MALDRRTQQVAIGAALLAALAGIGLGIRTYQGRRQGAPPVASSQDNEPAPLPPAGPAEFALLAPLAAGSEVESFSLREITGIHDGVFRVIFEPPRGRGRVEIMIALKDDKGPEPPAVADRYALYYSVKQVLADEADKITKVVAQRLLANKGAPTPPGMTQFHATDRPQQPL